MERFWAKVNKSDECWIWTGAKRGQYGVFWMDGKLHPAHRVAYQMDGGEVEDGEVVDHICFNRARVRPSHLRAVSQKQNCEHRSSGGVSGARGVHFEKRRQRWMAHVTHNYKFHFGGYFDTFEEAKERAQELRRELFTHAD